MQLQDIIIVTITLARTPSEERLLLSALSKLQPYRVPIIAAHGGPESRFVNRLRDLGITVVFPKRKGLVAQIKAGFEAALKKSPKAILYTEPDKYPFFTGPLQEFVRRARAGSKFGLAIAARDAKSFRTFPEGQQWTEHFTNEVVHFLLKEKSAAPADYCYGPLLLSPRVAELALESGDDFAWGWRHYAMIRARQEKLSLQSIPMNLPCPKEQRGEDTRADRIYRLKQLRSNLTALEAASQPARG
jgi:hypothetical protein